MQKLFEMYQNQQIKLSQVKIIVRFEIVFLAFDNLFVYSEKIKNKH